MSTVPKKAAFLKAFAACANISKAAAAVKMDRAMHYQWMEKDPDYPALFEQAQREAAQTLEDEAVRRAHEGVVMPILYHGRVCYEAVLGPDGQPLREPEFNEAGLPLVDALGNPVTRQVMKPLMKREYSDTLLQTLLKAFRPEKYRDSSTVEHTGAGGRPIELQVTFVKPEST